MSQVKRKSQQRLNKTTSSGDASPDYGRHYAERKRMMVRKMLSLGYQMRYDLPRDEAQKMLPPALINFRNVSAWCESDKCCIRKPLNKLTYSELPQVISQFELVLKDFIRKYAR